MERIVLSLLFILYTLPEAPPSSFDRNYNFLSSGNVVQDKNFYLLTLLQQLPELRHAVEEDGSCRALRRAQSERLQAALSRGKREGSARLLQDALFEDTAIATAMTAITRLDSRLLRQLIREHIIPSGYFMKYAGQDGDSLLAGALADALAGIDGIIRTYGLGMKGRYPDIDSPLFNVYAPAYQDTLSVIVGKALDEAGDDAPFFTVSLNIALALLRINKDDQPARFEPLIRGENSRAFRQLPRTSWSKYPYAAILVPGNGPHGNESLSKGGKKRLELAVQRYNRNMAPYIIVSGGNVHPFQTPFNEAIEMKKELISRHRIPEGDIIVEPYARHTTTNIRNCNRLIYRYGFPIGMKILITTDKKQAEKIADTAFVTRCRREIGHQPFFRLSKVSDEDLEYVPVMRSLFMDCSDPLDP